MAELLVKAIDYIHPDPDIDKQGAYKRGDVVVVKPDGWSWGKLETEAPVDGGKFFIVKVPGESVNDVLHFAESETTGSEGEVVRRRAWGLQVNELPPGIITALNTPGAANLPIATLLSAMERKADGVRGDEV